MYELQKRALERKARLQQRAKERAYDRRTAPAERTGRNYLFSLRGRAKAKGIDFDLTEEWMTAKMKLEHCEATGIRFEGARTDPFGMTIDRKDSAKGYTIENCWAVCWIYNRCKLDGTHDDVMRLARALVCQ